MPVLVNFLAGLAAGEGQPQGRQDGTCSPNAPRPRWDSMDSRSLRSGQAVGRVLGRGHTGRAIVFVPSLRASADMDTF